MNTLAVVLVVIMAMVIGAMLALGIIGVIFIRRVLRRMDEIEVAMKNIKVEIVNE